MLSSYSRLQTIIDCDQVLVFAAGRLTEIGHPHILLSRYLGDVIPETAGAGAGAGAASAEEGEGAKRGVATGDVRTDTRTSEVLVHTDAQQTSSSLSSTSATAPASASASVGPPRDTLASLVTETGPAMAMKLRVMAAAAYTGAENKTE
jgi:hypothetical protein